MVGSLGPGRFGLSRRQAITRVVWCAAAILLTAIPAAHTGGAADKPYLTLATTTTTENSGLMAYLLPRFEAKSGIKVRVVIQGTGQALRTAKKGDVDVLLAHDPTGERAFVKGGFGVHRRLVMYNAFVVVGPKDDPAGITGLRDAAAAFARIAAKKSAFVSRGDDSGTHRAERRTWQRTGLAVPTAKRRGWYFEAGAGMGATLNVAAGKAAYALTDQATWANFRNRGNLVVLAQGDRRLRNQYAVTLVNPGRHGHVKVKLARRFMDWLTSSSGQAAIAGYRIGGRQVFFPNHGQDES